MAASKALSSRPIATADGPAASGFVSMPNDDEAEKAMAALNGKDLGGRALTVNEARPQTQRSGFREGGRGGDRNSRQRRGPRW